MKSFIMKHTANYSVFLIAIFSFCAIFSASTTAQPTNATYTLKPRDADDVPLSRFAARRERVLQTMSAKSFAVYFAADERNRQNDVLYEYRQNSNVQYLCGFPESESVLLLIPGGIVLPSDIDTSGKVHTALLFVQKRNAQTELWTGAITGSERARTMYGIMALDNTNFQSTLSRLLQGAAFNGSTDSTLRRDTLFTDGFPTETVTEPISGDILSLQREAKVRLTKTFPSAVIRSHKRLIAEMRTIKDSSEIVVLKKAIAISCAGHRETMRFVRTMQHEYEAESVMEATFRRLGAEDVGYASIVGAGANACVLHYTQNRRQMLPGELLLMDCGAEYHGYTADITRTIPVSGTFSADQRKLYDIVYAAQEAALKEYRAGVDWRTPHSRAVDVIRAGLLKLGIITNPDDYKCYFPHGSVHYIGLDVHDAGSYSTFKAGMVLTCEPGLYIPEGSPCDKKWWNIGIRIEDDVLITEGEPLVISSELPRTSTDIERLIQGTQKQTRTLRR
jgi:Xaa-Pro aminopeptidase